MGREIPYMPILSLTIIIFSLVCNIVATSDNLEKSKRFTEQSDEMSAEMSKENYDIAENLYEADDADVITESDFLKNCGRVDRCVRNESNPWDAFFQLDPHQCRCDDENSCLEYGDCCFTNVTKIAKNNRWKCSQLQSKTWALMISSCSADNKDERLEKFCTLQSLFDTDYTYDLDLPVYSKSGKFYRNINCALCSGASINDIKTLNARILCNRNLTQMQIDEFVKESLYKTGERYYEYFNIFCGVYIPEFDAQQINKTNPQTRFCGPVVDYCPIGMDNRISQLCSSYRQPVQTASKEVYKNAHCAQCNGNHNASLCFRDSTPPSRIESDLIIGPRGLPFIYDYTCEMRKLLEEEENDTVIGKFIVADCYLDRNSDNEVNSTAKTEIIINVESAKDPLFPVNILIYISLITVIISSNTIELN